MVQYILYHKERPMACRNPFSCRSLNGGPDIPLDMSTQEPSVIRLWRVNPGKAELKDLSCKLGPSQPHHRARTRSDSPICAAHAEFVAALAGDPPRTIPLDADAIDLEDRANHLGKVFGALSVYVAVILDDTAQNVPGRLDLPNIEAILADLASDVTGTIQHAADDMAGRSA
jgi:hypothetical protein